MKCGTFFAIFVIGCRVTHAQKNSLGFAVRLAHGYCMDLSDVLTKWLADHPDVDVKEARSFISMSHGVPFPSIRGKVEGPFPIYPERPYYDARVHESIE